mgnify:CR=1 FL=1
MITFCCPQLLLSGTRVHFKKMTETQSQLCQTVHFYLFGINKYLIYICMATMASTSTNIVANVVTGLVGKFFRTLQQLEKQQASILLCHCVPQGILGFPRSGS